MIQASEKKFAKNKFKVNYQENAGRLICGKLGKVHIKIFILLCRHNSLIP